jgi:KDO2-lipid IV(A) lauroyltransferase
VLFRVRGGYRFIIEKPLQDFPSDDPQADAAAINGIFERWTRSAPEQYNWIHRRFKTPRGGGRSPYKKRAPDVAV